MSLAFLALASGCGATVADPEMAESEGHFPAEMPMVTYYDPVPNGPMGSRAVQEEAVDQDDTVTMIP